MSLKCGESRVWRRNPTQRAVDWWVWEALAGKSYKGRFRRPEGSRACSLSQWGRVHLNLLPRGWPDSSEPHCPRIDKRRSSWRMIIASKKPKWQKCWSKERVRFNRSVKSITRWGGRIQHWAHTSQWSIPGNPQVSSATRQSAWRFPKADFSYHIHI